MGGLTKFNNRLELEANLAESWNINKEQKTITIKLRKDIDWSDGLELSAKHFIDSWERLLNPKTGADYAYFLYDIKNAKEYNLGLVNDFNKVGVKALDKKTIKIELVENKSYFMSLLSFMSTFPIRVEKINKHKEEWVKPKNIVTLGKYTLEKWENHDYILLRPNDKSLDSVFISPVFKVILESNINISNKEANIQVLLSKKSVVFLTPPICCESPPNEDDNPPPFGF